MKAMCINVNDTPYFLKNSDPVSTDLLHQAMYLSLLSPGKTKM